jgi:putative flavoprotein involved in K+ transport
MPPQRFAPTRIEAAPPLSLALKDFRTVLWATGYRPDFSWLDVPVFDRKGRIRHEGGVVEAPGLYLMGMPFLRRRKSALIDGAGADSNELAAHLRGYLGATADRRSSGPRARRHRLPPADRAAAPTAAPAWRGQ